MVYFYLENIFLVFSNAALFNRRNSMKRTIAVLGTLYAISLLVACTRPVYVVGGSSIGSPESVEVFFSNGNTVESKITYRLLVNDPEGMYTLVVIKPQETSVLVRVPIGRVNIVYELYHGIRYRRTKRVDILINPPKPAIKQYITFKE